jgi:hypothetical protein
MTTTRAHKQPVRCECGREFTNRAGFANHARKCPQEVARSEAFIARIERGEPLFEGEPVRDYLTAADTGTFFVDSSSYRGPDRRSPGRRLTVKRADELSPGDVWWPKTTVRQVVEKVGLAQGFGPLRVPFLHVAGVGSWVDRRTGAWIADRDDWTESVHGDEWAVVEHG